jgi:hypothetical protein
VAIKRVNAAAKIIFAPRRKTLVLFVSRIGLASERETEMRLLILQFAFVHHVGHFEAAIDLEDLT